MNEAQRLYEEVIHRYQDKDKGQGQDQGSDKDNDKGQDEDEDKDVDKDKDDRLYVYNAMGNLAILVTDQGEYSRARELYEQALVGKEKTLGPLHASTLTTMNNYGVLLKKLGRYEEVTINNLSILC